MKKRSWVGAVGAAWLVLAVSIGVDAQGTKTPEATSFEVWVADAEHLIVGIVETVPGTDEGVGFAIRCVRASGALEGSMAFRVLSCGETGSGGGPRSFRPRREVRAGGGRRAGLGVSRT